MPPLDMDKWQWQKQVTADLERMVPTVARVSNDGRDGERRGEGAVARGSNNRSRTDGADGDGSEEQ